MGPCSVGAEEGIGEDDAVSHECDDGNLRWFSGDDLGLIFGFHVAIKAGSSELTTKMGRLFLKRRNAADAISSVQRVVLKLKTVATEKKITNLLDRILGYESSTVISAYVRKVEDLERQKLLEQEKSSRCETFARGYDEAFRITLGTIDKSLNIWPKNV